MGRISRSSEPTVLIVGAGMTGLMAAAALQDLGPRVSLVDKGRSPGGRLATRRIAGGRADHGAQFFTARSPQFRAWVEQWEAAGLAYAWSTGWSDGSAAAPGDAGAPGDAAAPGEAAAPGGHPRYAVRDGMNMLAKSLAAQVSAAGAAVHTGVRVQAISRTDNNWWVCSDDGRVYQGTLLLLTSPVPQSLALLEEGGVALAPADLERLQAIRYAPCVTVMVAVEGEVALPEPGAVQQPGAAVTWIADNQRKGLSPGRRVITLQAGAELSRRLLDAPDEEALAAILPALEPWLAVGAALGEAQVKRWRYANPEVLHDAPSLQASDQPALWFGGDAFGGARVEGAALSGLALADQVRIALAAAGVATADHR